jgi:hypothetical protein
LFGFIMLLGTAVSVSDVPAPVFTATTAKDPTEFRQCFISAQQAEKRDWWFVPDQRGGKFSNEGGRGVANPYRLVVRQEGGPTQLRVYMGGSETDQRGVVGAVKNCA